MDGFIHRENLRLFRKRLENQSLNETERKIILRLLAEEQAKKPQSCRDEVEALVNDRPDTVHELRPTIPRTNLRRLS
jgi:hypothetical protein